ncbi:MAG: tetratricopeptide repeat protein [Chloroflexi bacterium]|nr:tetratricopeptide repeat protein [Chloroflexota bacterium]
MKIRIWGARGSIPASLKSEQVEEKICQAILGMPAGIDTKDEAAVRAYVGGLPPLLRGTAGTDTPCVEIRAGEDILIVDAGSGFSALGEELSKGPFGRGEGTLHLLMSHLHWDHIQGFPMFMPAFIPGNRILIYGIHDVRPILERQQSSPTWPPSAAFARMNADIEFISLQEGQPFAIGKVLINTIRNTHPNRSYSYRFEDQHSVFVYASDAEYKELDDASVQPHIEFFKGADALIFDAQYTLTQAWRNVDWGHSSAMIGVDLARAAEVKRLILFHHHNTHSDADLQEIQETAIAYQAEDTTRPTCEIMVAYEGLTLDLAPPDAVDLQFTLGGEAAILTPSTVFDERGVDQLAQQLIRLAEQDAQARSIIDLSHVETLTTASLKSLVALRQEQRGDPIVLVGPSSSVRQVIKLAGCLDYFAVYPSVETALEAVQTREALNLPGHIIKDRYQIQNKVGDGQMGTVLKAIDIHMDRTVAVNILFPYFSDETIDRLMRQSKQITSLDHRNIVQVFDWDQEVGYSFRVEEFIVEPTLQDILSERDAPLPIEQAVDIALDIIAALECAHSWGVIHGDLKPQNIFMTGDGSRLTGFGLGLLEEGRNLLDAPLILLTTFHLAPEQILGQSLDVRTDLYALGVILYQLLTSRLPFEGSDRKVMQAHLESPPIPPSELNPHISFIMEHLILRLLAKDPDDRYASARQVARILRNLIASGKQTTRQRQKIVVGREKSLQTLQTCWEQALVGRGQLAFIAGKPGIGKTSLAWQLAAAQGDPPMLLVGRCQALKENPPYYLFSEVLRAYLDAVSPESLDQESQQLFSNFIYLIPEIRQMLPNLPEATRLKPRQEQLRLVASLTRFIERATQERPWLLILDDLQWADHSSLELLSSLGRHIPSMALFVIGTYCDIGLDHSHPLLESLRDLSIRPTYHRISLDGLDQKNVEQILLTTWSQPAPQSLIEKIHQHTEGNPLYVGEIARGLVDDGLVVLKDGKQRFPAMGEMRLQPNMRTTIWRRVRHLSPDEQTLLRQASVLGQVFRFDDLQAMSGLSEAEVLKYLDVALERQLVWEAPGRELFHFCHPEIQDVLYVDLGGRQRRLLHRQAGEAIELRAERESERVVEELARHFSEAGEIERAVTCSIQAARWAKVVYANGAALLWYTQALEMLDQLDTEEASQFQALRLSAHKSLSEVLTQIGRYDDALEHYASILFRWLGKGARYVAQVEQTIEIVRIYLFGAELYYRQGKYDEAVSWCQQSLDIVSQIETRESQQIRGGACNLLGDICIRSGVLSYAVQFCNESVLVYQGINDVAGQANAYNNLGLAYYYLGDWSQARDAYHKSLAMREKIDDFSGWGQASNNLALVHLDCGDWDRALSLLEQSLDIWKQTSAMEEEARTLSHLGQMYIFYQENWDEALACLNRSQDTFILAGSDDYLPELERRWGEFYLGTGELDQALDHALRSVELAVEQSHSLKEGLSCRILGRVHLARREDEPAEAALRQSLQIFNDLDSKYEIAKTQLFLVRLAVETGIIPEDEARTYLAQAIPLFEELGARVDLDKARDLEQQLG